MSKCPFCNASLSAADLRSGNCPACHGVLPPVSDADRAAGQTVDERAFVPAAMGDAPAAGDLADVRQTVDEHGLSGSTDSGEVPAGQGPDKGTVDDRSVKQTITPDAAASERHAGPQDTIDERNMPPTAGAPFPPDQRRPIDDQQRIDQTLDSTDFPTGVPGGERGTADERRIDQTLDSTDIPVLMQGDARQTIGEVPKGDVRQTVDDVRAAQQPAPGDTRQTIGEPRIDQTLDSTDLTAAQSVDQRDTASDPRIDQTLDSTNLPQPISADEQGTVPDRQLQQTLDSTDLPPGGVKDGKGTVTDRQVAQTIDSTSFPGTVPDDQHATADDRSTVNDPRLAQTMDSTDAIPPMTKRGGTVHDRTDQTLDITPADVTRMTNMWQPTLGKGVTPMTSIKTDAATAVARSTLVIQPRVLRTPAKAARTSADYDLLNLLGEGGMGMVYAARQASIDRTVALKMLKPDTAKDRQQRDKFLSEAVITGDLEHPNIVPIYDLGSNEEGALFYSMKRVQGTPWMEAIGQKSLHENIEILMKVADAVAFAHSRKVIHRDLKPENIMLGGFGEVLVMDWGLAIPADKRKFGGITQSVSMGGTPAYMAPEMAAGPFERIGFGSDIYLLGAMLFEIITGRPPHTGKDVMKCLFAAAKNQIVETEKKGELLDIALQAMATDPADRHPTVQDFQDAIRDYLSHSESIALSTRATEDLEQAEKTNDYQDYARALFGFQEAYSLWDGNTTAQEGLSTTSLAYAGSAMRKGDFDLGLSLLDAKNADHVQLIGEIKEAQKEREARQQRLKTLRRAMVVGVVVFLMFLTGGSLWILKERNAALAAEGKALEEKDKADKARVAADNARVAAEASEAKAVEATKTAVEEKDKADQARDDADKARVAADDARVKAEASEAKAVAATKTAVEEKQKAEYEAYIALIGLAAAKIDENAFGTARQLLDQCPKELRNWEWGRLDHMCRQSINDYPVGAPVDAIAVSRDGTRFVTGGWNGKAMLWDVSRHDKPERVFDHGELNFVHAVAISPDGSLVATGSNDEKGGYLRIWNAETGELVRRLDGHDDAVVSIAFSADGKRLLTGSFDYTAKLWDLAGGQVMQTLQGHRNWVWSAAFRYEYDEAGNLLTSVVEKQIVTASEDGYAVVWTDKGGDWKDAQKIERSPPFRGHVGPIYAAAFSPGGQRVATGGYDKRILIWNPSEVQAYDYKSEIENYLAGLRGANQDSGAGRAAVSGPKYQALDGHTAAVRSVSFDRQGNRILSGGQDNTVRVWDARSQRPIKVLRGHDSWVRSCVFIPEAAAADAAGGGARQDEQWVLSGSHDRFAKQWSIESYEEVRRVAQGRVFEGHDADILSASFSKDGGHIVTASQDRTARMWNADDGSEEHTFREGHAFLASRAIFTPDGKKLITSAVDSTTRIWDITSGTELTRLDATGRFAAAAVAPNGDWLVTGSDDNTAKIWKLVIKPDVDGNVSYQGELTHTLGGHNSLVSAVAVSPDSKIVFTGDANGRGKLWDAGTGMPMPGIADLLSHVDRITAAAFLPDGSRLLTASGDNSVVQWDVKTGKELTPLRMMHPKSVLAMTVTPDGRFALTSAADKRVRVWDIQRVAVVKELTPKAPKLDASGKRLGEVNSLAVSADGKLALTVNSDARIVRLWDLDSGQEILPPAAVGDVDDGPYLDFANRGLIWSASFAPNQTQVATVGGNNARMWDFKVAERPVQPRMVFVPHDSVAAASFSNDGKYVVTGSWDSTARIWSTETGKDVIILGAEGIRRINSVAFSPDDQYVLTASDDKTAKLWKLDWDAKTGTVEREFKGHTDAVLWAVFSSDGKLVLTASNDATARVWDTQSGRTVHVLKSSTDYEHGHKYGIWRAAFSGDDQRVITGSKDNTARIWNLNGEKVEVVLEGHTAAVTSVAFSSDDERALTGSEDFTAKIWDAEKPAQQPAAQDAANAAAVENPAADPAPAAPEQVAGQPNEPKKGKEILTLKGHTQEVTSVGFSHDGSRALTGSRDGSAIIWLTSKWEEKPLPPIQVGQAR